MKCLKNKNRQNSWRRKKLEFLVVLDANAGKKEKVGWSQFYRQPDKSFVRRLFKQNLLCFKILKTKFSDLILKAHKLCFWCSKKKGLDHVLFESLRQCQQKVRKSLSKGWRLDHHFWRFYEKNLGASSPAYGLILGWTVEEFSANHKSVGSLSKVLGKGECKNWGQAGFFFLGLPEKIKFLIYLFQ